MRTYLDWNATTPLREETKAAIRDAMEMEGNPSSVHSEGRAAKMALERAREQVAVALGAEGEVVNFTAGASEAAAMVLAGQGMSCAAVEHSAVKAWCEVDLAVDRNGIVTVPDPARTSLQLANNETGVVQALPEGLASSDLTQAFCKIPFAFNWLGIQAGFVAAQKLGGPRGVGALVIRRGTEIERRLLQHRILPRQPRQDQPHQIILQRLPRIVQAHGLHHQRRKGFNLCNGSGIK